MRYFVGVGAGIVGGLIVGWVAGSIYASEIERRYQSNEAVERAKEKVTTTNIFEQYPVNDPQDVESHDEIAVVGGEIEGHDDPNLLLPEDPEGVNDYLKLVQNQETTQLHQYITEEEYEEVDGNNKLLMTIMVTDEEPVFILSGFECIDWPDLIGENILRDFYTLVPPGDSRVLYVRNNALDTDYEVSIDTP